MFKNQIILDLFDYICRYYGNKLQESLEKVNDMVIDLYDTIVLIYICKKHERNN